MRSTGLALATLAACALSACGGGVPREEMVREGDPALANAIAEPILIDPDLVALNRANGVVSLPPQDGSLPTIDNDPDTIAAARTEAVKLVGGPGNMRKAPEPMEVAGGLPEGAALTAATLAAASSPGSAYCASRAEYTMRWAARLPAPFPVYPRGAVQEAAGTDADDCSLRVVSYLTPVPLGEVMDFYFTRARAAGYSAERVLHDGNDVLSGQSGRASYVVYARRLPTGNTEVDLVTSGRR